MPKAGTTNQLTQKIVQKSHVSKSYKRLTKMAGEIKSELDRLNSMIPSSSIPCGNYKEALKYNKKNGK